MQCELFEKQFLELFSELQLITLSESRLRDAVRAESMRAEAAEAARDAAERTAMEARNGAAAAAAAATQATATLTKIQEELTSVKMQLELSERQRTLLEGRCLEMSEQERGIKRELQQLHALESIHAALQREYTELQERIRVATEEARSEASRLESELKRLEKCAEAGAEIRKRARLAASAHACEKRLTADELQHTIRKLRAANGEISKLRAIIAELKSRLTENETSKKASVQNLDTEALKEVRAALQAEQAGSTQLEHALTAALADNATLAAHLHSIDNCIDTKKASCPPATPPLSTNISPIDSFLAD